MALAPGEEGEWFVAAKHAELFDEAIALVSRAPTDPRMPTGAARDFAETRPAFAVVAGIAALRWIAEGYGYEITGVDVVSAHQHTVKAAAQQGCVDTTLDRLREFLVADTARGPFIAKILGRELDRVPDG